MVDLEAASNLGLGQLVFAVLLVGVGVDPACAFYLETGAVLLLAESGAGPVQRHLLEKVGREPVDVEFDGGAGLGRGVLDPE